MTSTSIRVYRWHPLVPLFALAVGLWLLVLMVSELPKPFAVAEWVVLGLVGFFTLGPLWLAVEMYVVTEQGVEQRVLGWKRLVRWDDIQELTSGRDDMVGLGGFSVWTTPQRPSHGKPLELQLQVLNLLRGSADLKTLIIERAHLSKVSSEGEAERYVRR